MLVRTSATLCLLRQAVAKIERQQTDIGDDAQALPFGVRPIDAVLRGGLSPACLHEITPTATHDFGAAAGFTLALTARAAGGRSVLWIQTDFAVRGAGNIYGPGCDPAGLPTRQLLVLKVPRPFDALWAMEEALKCRALAGVVAELPDDGPIADLTAARRLTLAARENGGFGFLLRHRSSPLASSAETRWEVATAPSRSDQFGGLGRPAWTLSLVKNRRGPVGQWTIAWNHHERAFSPLPLGVAQAAFGRSDRTLLAHAG